MDEWDLAKSREKAKRGAERLQSHVKEETIGGAGDIWPRGQTTQEGHDICIEEF